MIVITKLKLVNTNAFSCLTRRNKTGELMYSPEGFAMHRVNQNIQPILISEYSKVEIGDLFYTGGMICQAIEGTDERMIQYLEEEGNVPCRTHRSLCEKVILTAENFAEKDFQAIANGYLKDGDIIRYDTEKNQIIPEEKMYTTRDVIAINADFCLEMIATLGLPVVEISEFRQKWFKERFR